eukprot:CAMPEP_0171894740 /NCGR_PEP_ID=MMETSP0992-20121227/46624_1 /TAXON_ID=483369 /ORGANISM="non described non described, Strain CCMP2098" /LENGTH=105 /DNA_ID=CAMNT_0012522543 /DNA_START=124 /DNA_END=441 /DNA_ORIENTATION=+
MSNEAAFNVERMACVHCSEVFFPMFSTGGADHCSRDCRAMDLVHGPFVRKALARKLDRKRFQDQDRQQHRSDTSRDVEEGLRHQHPKQARAEPDLVLAGKPRKSQ